MKVLGVVLSVIGILLMIFGGMIGREVYTPGIGLYGIGYSSRVANIPMLIIGGILLIVGVILFVSSRLSKSQEDVKLQDNNFIGKSLLDNDAYKIYLTRQYSIEHNSVLGKYISQDKLFDTVDEALNYAKEVDWKRFGIVDGVVKAKIFGDGQLICPKCHTKNDPKRKNCRYCNYELIAGDYS
jgi:hypothetical protein